VHGVETTHFRPTSPEHQTFLVLSIVTNNKAQRNRGRTMPAAFYTPKDALAIDLRFLLKLILPPDRAGNWLAVQIKRCLNR